MRNPDRIKDMMSILTEIWELQPDIRFNQLIRNLQMEYDNGSYVKKAFIDEAGWGTVDVSYPDLFHVEDDKFLDFLQWKYNELQNKN